MTGQQSEIDQNVWPEPQPADGPEYHTDHAFWREAMTRRGCPECGRGTTGLCVDCTEDGVFGHQANPPAEQRAGDAPRIVSNRPERSEA